MKPASTHFVSPMETTQRITGRNPASSHPSTDGLSRKHGVQARENDGQPPQASERLSPRYVWHLSVHAQSDVRRAGASRSGLGGIPLFGMAARAASGLCPLHRAFLDRTRRDYLVGQVRPSLFRLRVAGAKLAVRTLPTVNRDVLCAALHVRGLSRLQAHPRGVCRV
jgi:hypothetical protein